MSNRRRATYRLTKLQVGLACTTTDFSLNEIRPLREIIHTGDWDRKIVVYSLIPGDIGIDKEKNAFMYSGRSWNAINFKFEE